MNAQQMAMLAQMNQMNAGAGGVNQLQQLQQLQQMQQQMYGGQQPAAFPAYTAMPAGMPTGMPAAMPAGGMPAYSAPPPSATPTPDGAYPGVGVTNMKAVKLPDGVSMMSLNLGEITCRGPTGSLISMRPPPPKPDFEKEMNVKPVPYAAPKTGQCHKLGFKKTLGMCRWHKRTFKLENNKFDWNGKEHKIIELKPGVIIEKADHDSPKRRDAHDIASISALTTPMFATHVGEVGKHHSIGIHVPVDPFAGINHVVGMASKSPLQLMMHSKDMHPPSDITYYFHFDSDAERDEWYQALTQNLEAARTQNYVPFQYFVNLATQAGVANASTFNWQEIVTALYADH